jgi:hypothetical protein
MMHKPTVSANDDKTLGLVLATDNPDCTAAPTHISSFSSHCSLVGPPFPAIHAAVFGGLYPATPLSLNGSDDFPADDPVPDRVEMA